MGVVIVARDDRDVEDSDESDDDEFVVSMGTNVAMAVCFISYIYCLDQDRIRS